MGQIIWKSVERDGPPSDDRDVLAFIPSDDVDDGFSGVIKCHYDPAFSGFVDHLSGGLFEATHWAEPNLPTPD